MATWKSRGSKSAQHPAYMRSPTRTTDKTQPTHPLRRVCGPIRLPPCHENPPMRKHGAPCVMMDVYGCPNPEPAYTTLPRPPKPMQRRIVTARHHNLLQRVWCYLVPLPA
ncbi:hypothetical protein BS47DRAFT_1365091 [Hydnum rufescens UP504]|uniref:Uncharacterized protein n=1 Tax=Hydnum rufescens UP504 TaxID=1448309 RepID=A0A9P6DTL0_9AGAM|nr:hypothetical protein BS47DRAFT_1365091 [Hydnum rufescens UP504]